MERIFQNCVLSFCLAVHLASHSCYATVAYYQTIETRFYNRPTRGVGALIWEDSFLMYLHELCYYTTIHLRWGISTCSCISVIDNEFIPEDVFRPRDMHTKLIGLYEGYLAIPAYGSQPFGTGTIVLAVRHPKCHKSKGYVRFNMGAIHTVHLDNPNFKTFPMVYHSANSTLGEKFFTYNQQAYYELKNYAYWNTCTVYKAEARYNFAAGGIPMKKCTLWPAGVQLVETESVKNDVQNEGRVCLEKVRCEYSLGFPVTCGSNNLLLGIISGDCHNCRNAEMYLVEEFVKPYTHFTSIKEKFNKSLIINESREMRDPHFVFYRVPNSSNKVASNYILTLILKVKEGMDLLQNILPTVLNSY